ncbi:BTAD domain-containing putative transcriptional regulator, partial [Streptomyces sp. NPDC020766]|uniref:BTAD domain-containing putative transcriptional regulator n=1 Tax=Streptomyces sp. NPDC020766 TaxID=3155011 RepID=UPI0033EA1BD8
MTQLAQSVRGLLRWDDGGLRTGRRLGEGGCHRSGTTFVDLGCVGAACAGERCRGLMKAYYAEGRQADAIQVFHRAKDILREQIGI